jgi:hypothetical protein
MAARTDDLVKVRLRIDVLGTFDNVGSLKRGDIVECPRSHAERYTAVGYAEYRLTGDIGRMYNPH